jgi:hypothetical protein
VEELTSLARQLSPGEAQNVLKVTADRAPGLPAIVRLALLQVQLHGFAERRDLLETLPKLLPVLTGLSGAGFVRAMADAVMRTEAWDSVAAYSLPRPKVG